MADLRKLGFVGTIGDEDEIEVEPESSDSDNEEAQVICALFILSLYYVTESRCNDCFFAKTMK